MVSPGMAVAALRVRVAPIPRPRTAAGVDPIDAGRQGLPIGIAGAGGAIQAVVIVGIGRCDGHRCDHRHRVLDHQRRAGGITGAIAVGDAGCAHHRLTRLNALSAQRHGRPTAQGHTRAAIAPGIGGAELLGVRTLTVALQLTLLEVVTPLAGWMLTPLTLGALLETCTLSEESTLSPSASVAVMVHCTTSVGLTLLGLSVTDAPLPKLVPALRFSPAVAETGQAAVGVHRHTAAAEGARGGHPVGRRDGRSAGELRRC